MKNKGAEQRENNEVLIVDDNVANLQLLIEILSSAGYGVRQATSGKEALRLVMAKLPSLILLEVLLPEMDGFEVCRRLLANPETSKIPVLFISTLDDDQSKLRGFELGGVDFVIKPFRKEIVLARVKTHIKLTNVIQELEREKKLLLNEIVERRIAEAKLQESEELFRTALYGIGDGVITTDVQGRVKMMNQVAENLTGWTQAEAGGKVLEKVFRIVNEATRKEVEIPVRRVLREGIVVGLANHTILIAKDGNEMPIADSGAPIRNSKEEIAGVVLVFRDQTKERQAEKKLKASEEKFRSSVESSPIGMYFYQLQPDEKLIFKGANPAADVIIGVTHQHFIGKTILEAFPELAQTTIPELYTRIAKGEIGLQSFEIDYHDKNLANGFFKVTVYKTGDSTITVDFIDITEQKAAELALLKFKKGIDQSSKAIFITAIDGTIEYINDSFERIYGYTQEDALGKTPRILKSGLLSQSDYELFWNTLLAKKATSGEIINKTKDGRLISIEETTNPIINDKGEIIGFISINLDITERKKAEEELRMFRILIDGSNDAIEILDPETGNFLDVNERDCLDLGYSRDEFLSLTVFDIDPTIDKPTFEKLIAELIIAENKILEGVHIRKDGSSFPVEVSLKLIRFERDYLIAVVRDITERMQAQATILDATQKMDAFFNQSMDGFFFMALDEPIEWNETSGKEKLLLYSLSHLRVSRINEAMLAQYGADPIQMLGITLNDFFAHNIEQGKNLIREIYDRGKLHVETEERKMNGEIMFVEGDYTCLYDSEGRITGLFGIQSDVTESKKMVNNIQESEAKYRYLFENNPAPMWIYDLDTLLFLEVNQAAIDHYGYSHQEFLNMTIKEIRPAEDINQLLTDVDSTTHILNHAGTWRHRKKNGELIYVDITSHLIDFDERQARLVISTDITDRINAQIELEKEKQLLRTLIDNLPDPIYVKDREGRKMIANMADVQNIGCSSEADTLGKTDLELFGSEIGQRGYKEDLQVIESGQSILNQLNVFAKSNGLHRWLLTSKVPLFDENGKSIGLVGIGRDITEIKMAEEQINKLTKSIEQSPSTYIITDTNGNIEYVNPKFSEITGYTKEEAIGQNPRILKSGEMPAEVYVQLWEAITSGEVWRGEFLNRKKNGELYWEWATMTSIKNEDGLITNYIAIKEDISLRKQMESDLIIAKEKAEESDRLKSAFLANMSHEIRTPLNSIIGFSELLYDADFNTEQKDEFIHHIITNGNNLLTIISDIMDISKIESGELKVYKNRIHILELILKLKDHYTIEFEGRETEFKVDIPDQISEIVILADENRLMQVFNNLISNALKFTSKGYIQIGFQIQGQMAEFYVRDTGIGIPDEFHTKIFDRFRQVEDSKNRKYGGNGLGLAITKNLIELMGGEIRLESEIGKGSAFYFTIPMG